MREMNVMSIKVISKIFFKSVQQLFLIVLVLVKVHISLSCFGIHPNLEAYIKWQTLWGENYLTTSVQKEVQKVCFVNWLFPESYINPQKAKRYKVVNKVVQFRETLP